MINTSLGEDLHGISTWFSGKLKIVFQNIIWIFYPACKLLINDNIISDLNIEVIILIINFRIVSLLNASDEKEPLSTCAQRRPRLCSLIKVYHIYPFNFFPNSF